MTTKPILDAPAVEGATARLDELRRAGWCLCDDTEGTVHTDEFGEHYRVPKASWDRLAKAIDDWSRMRCPTCLNFIDQCGKTRPCVPVDDNAAVASIDWKDRALAAEAREAALLERVEAVEADAARYRFLRNRDPGPAKHSPPGLFIGQVPENLILTDEEADSAIDAALSPAQASPKAVEAWRPDRDEIAQLVWTAIDECGDGSMPAALDPGWAGAFAASYDAADAIRALPAAAPDQPSKDREDDQ